MLTECCVLATHFCGEEELRTSCPLEATLWVLRSNACHWCSVTKRGCENEVVSASCEFFHNGFSFVAFWNVLYALNFDTEF